MKTGLKIWTAFSAFFPPLFFVIYIVWLIGNTVALNSPDMSSGMFMSLMFMMVLLLLYTGCYYFNLIFYIVYLIKSRRFTSGQTIMWILLMFFFGLIVAPVFWCVYLRPLSPDEPMFPPKDTTAY